MDIGSNTKVCDGDVCCYGWIFLDDSGSYTAFPVPYPLIWDKNGRAKAAYLQANQAVSPFSRGN